jgi:hypothetical protein
MATRTTKRTVTFSKPFILSGFDEELPAGDYLVDTDEDLLQSLSFPAYVRVLSVIHLPDKSGIPRLSRALTIDPHELDSALMRDQGLPEFFPSDGVHRPSVGQFALEAAENEGMMVHVH